MQPTASKIITPPSTISAPVKPLPPVVPPKPVVEVKQKVTTSVTMAIDANSVESASVTKAVSPPPPISVTPVSVDEVAKATPITLNTPGVSNSQGSYLQSISNALDGNAKPKSSYSPFSNIKKASANDSLYNAPSTLSVQANDEHAEPSTFEDSSALDTVTSGGSYLESMPGSGGSLKSSYSPFSNPKQTSTNDSLYNAPSTVLPQAEEEYEEPLTVEDTIAANTVTSGGSYLDSMSGSGGSLKSSYSPFGTPKIRSNDSLYAPPEAGTDSEEQTGANGSSYFDSLSGANGDGQAALKASYSPFGSPKVVTNDSLYGPPDTPFVPEDAEASALPINEDRKSVV